MMKLGVYALGVGFLSGTTAGQAKQQGYTVVSAASYRAKRKADISRGISLRRALMQKGTIKD